MPSKDSTFKSAREEAREILEGMSISEFRATVRNKIGVPASQNHDEPDEQWKKRTIGLLLAWYDNTEGFGTRMCRALDILIDDERKHKLVSEQVDLTRRATEASERSADSAARSADAAEQSKDSAASIVRTKWIMFGIAALTFILALIVAIWK